MNRNAFKFVSATFSSSIARNDEEFQFALKKESDPAMGVIKHTISLSRDNRSVNLTRTEQLSGQRDFQFQGTGVDEQDLLLFGMECLDLVGEAVFGMIAQGKVGEVFNHEEFAELLVDFVAKMEQESQ